jgi:hypothetical protein
MTTLTLEDRLATLERRVDAIYLRLGMSDDPTVPVGTAGIVLRPDQAPDPLATRLFDHMAHVQKGMDSPPLTPAEACAKYASEPVVLAHFKERLRISDGEDFTTIVATPGWHKLPARFRPQLMSQATVVPEEFAPA